ncbi:MAG: hypothetical protein FWC07_11630, partial [Defluviitaleaceae bacterium]|nr:hypothetical protein [Defluviitaleaceae bacterium]
PEAPPAPPVPPVPPAPPASPSIQSDLLERLDAIVQNTAHINEGVASIRQMAESGQLDEDTAEIFINGVVEIIRHREATNQKAIDLLKDMYNHGRHAGTVDTSVMKGLANLGHAGVDLNDLMNSLPPGDKMKFIAKLMGMEN